MISLAITTFNRTEFVIESFIKILDNDLINDIVIIDDHSDKSIFVILEGLIADLKNHKIKLHRNIVNIKPFVNKYVAVKACMNDWVILLDSDNIIDNDYIDIISKIEVDDTVMYCPSLLYKNEKDVQWDYGAFSGILTDRYNVKENFYKYNNFETSLNTGNHYVNRAKYMEVVENSKLDYRLSVNDALYFSYQWLLQDYKITVIKGLGYLHRIHDGSWYQNNFSACGNATKEIRKKLETIGDV